MPDQLLQAFASPIWLRKQLGSAALNQGIVNLLRQLAATACSDDQHRAHQGGFYTDGGLFTRKIPELAAIKSLAADSTEAYLTKLNKQKPVTASCSINGWAALTRAGDYQTPHVHAEATLSGIYYAHVPNRPAPEGCIDLLNPITAQELSFVPGCSPAYCRISPQAGDLLLFPAYLKHYTHPFTGDGERICIVFNALINRCNPSI